MPGGRPPKLITEAWVYAPVGNTEWAVGYRIETVSGAPYIAEQRMWPVDSPPWPEARLVPPERPTDYWTRAPRREVPSTPPNLDLARRALTPRQALHTWRDENERIEADEPGPDRRRWRGGNPLQPVPRLHGFDSMAPDKRRPDDLYYAQVAEKCVKCKQRSRQYAPALARELGVNEERARKLVWECRKRAMLQGDELTPYARELLDST